MCQIWYPLLAPVSRYWAKRRRGCFDFQISGQSLIKQNCLNSRTSDDIGMKLGPVTKIDKRNKTILKKIDDDVMSGNCDVIVIFPICSQFWAIWKAYFGRIVCKTYVFINSYLSSYKNWTENQNLKHSSHTIGLSKGTIFAKKCWFFAKIKILHKYVKEKVALIKNSLSFTVLKWHTILEFLFSNKTFAGRVINLCLI